MEKIEWRNEKINLSDLKTHAKNPRKISKDQLRDLKKSFEKFGYCEVVAINADGTILAGHQRIRTMIDLKMSKNPIDVRVPNRQLSDAEADEYLIRSNKNTGEWDFEKLEADFCVPDLVSWGFSEDELGKFSVKIEGVEDDFEPIIPENPKTNIGDFYELGPHKLFCCSSTDEKIREKIPENHVDLVLTDPPYNIAYEGKTSEKLKIQNDDMSRAEFREFLLKFHKNAFHFLKPGHTIYVFHADMEGENFRFAFRESGLKFSQCLIWAKNTLVFGRSDYQWQHEPCLYGWKPGSKHRWNSDRKQTTLLKFDRPERSVDHPTMKPVPLFCYLIGNSSLEGDSVFDGFLGSGTTLIACEQIGRKCIGCEIDQKYCDVIVDRYRAYKKSQGEPCIIKKNGVEIENG